MKFQNLAILIGIIVIVAAILFNQKIHQIIAAMHATQNNQNIQIAAMQNNQNIQIAAMNAMQNNQNIQIAAMNEMQNNQNIQIAEMQNNQNIQIGELKSLISSFNSTIHFELVAIKTSINSGFIELKDIFIKEMKAIYLNEN